MKLKDVTKLVWNFQPDYVVVVDPSNEECVELPVDSKDATLCCNFYCISLYLVQILALATLEHTFPGAHGLKYKNPKTGANRAVVYIL